jgi:hypothetical protein
MRFTGTVSLDWKDRSFMNDPLETYLQHHLAGANLAIELLRAMRIRHQDEPMVSFLEALLAEISEARDTLKRLAEKIGDGQSTLKELGAWLTEKISRFKLGAGANDPFESLKLSNFCHSAFSANSASGASFSAFSSGHSLNLTEQMDFSTRFAEDNRDSCYQQNDKRRH